MIAVTWCSYSMLVCQDYPTKQLLLLSPFIEENSRKRSSNNLLKFTLTILETRIFTQWYDFRVKFISIAI